MGTCLPPDGLGDTGGSRSLSNGLSLVPYLCGHRELLKIAQPSLLCPPIPSSNTQNHAPYPPTTEDSSRCGVPRQALPKPLSLPSSCPWWGRGGKLDNSASQRWREAWAARIKIFNEGSRNTKKIDMPNRVTKYLVYIKYLCKYYKVYNSI